MKPTRPRGTGRIFRQSGCSTWTIRYSLNGKRVQESTGTKDYRVARQRLTQRLAQCDRGEVIDLGRGTLCSDLWEGLARHYRINGRKSTECLPRRWKHLSPFFADMRAQQVTYQRLEEYVDARLAENAANATVNRELSSLKTAFRLGRKKQVIRDVPDFPHLTENNTRTNFLEDAGYATLAVQCSELWLRLFLEIAYSLAWRKSEILKLRVRDVSLAARTIRLDAGSTKNGEGREAPMSAAALPLVRQAIAGKGPDDFLLTRANGKPVRDFRGTWRNLTDAAGLPGLFVHDMRRSGARQLRQAGVPESVVQKIGGWKTAQMFKRYAIVSNADQREAMAKLDQARAGLGDDLGDDRTQSSATANPITAGKVQ